MTIARERGRDVLEGRMRDGQMLMTCWITFGHEERGRSERCRDEGGGDGMRGAEGGVEELGGRRNAGRTMDSIARPVPHDGAHRPLNQGACDPSMKGRWEPSRTLP